MASTLPPHAGSAGVYAARPSECRTAVSAARAAIHDLNAPASGAEPRPRSKRSRRTARSADAATNNPSVGAEAAEKSAGSSGAAATTHPTCVPAAMRNLRSSALPAAGFGLAHARWPVSPSARGAIPAVLPHVHAVAVTVLYTLTGRSVRSAMAATRQCVNTPMPVFSVNSVARSSGSPVQATGSADPAPGSISPTRASVAARAKRSSVSRCAPAASLRSDWPRRSVEKTPRSPRIGKTSTRLFPPRGAPAEWRIG